MATNTNLREFLSDKNKSTGEAPPKRRSDLVYRTVEGKTIILNPSKSVLHQLNETASFIWGCCDGTQSSDGIAGRLAAEYDVDSGTSRKDVDRVLSNLKKLNLLFID